MLKIKAYKVGRLKTNCYLIADEALGVAAILDPGGDVEDFESEILTKYKLEYILITHGHYDHIMNAGKYKQLSGAKIVISRKEKDFITDSSLNLSGKYLKQWTLKPFEPDILVDDGDEISFAGRVIKVLATPGHTVGGVSYILEDNIFSGDTLFCGDFGYSHFPTGNSAELKKSLKKIASLKGEYNVYPGHSQRTLLSHERKNIENF